MRLERSQARSTAPDRGLGIRSRNGSVLIGMGPVEAVLGPGEQALAEQLVADYGDAVQVSICADTTSCVGAPVLAAD